MVELRESLDSLKEIREKKALVSQHLAYTLVLGRKETA